MARAKIRAAAVALALTLSGAGLLVGSPGMGTAFAAETLGLDPDVAQPGMKVSVTDDAFADPGDDGLPTRCVISLDGEEVSEDCAVNSDGELFATFTVGDDVEPGEYEVEVTAGDRSATAQLTVEKKADQIVTTPAGRSDKDGRTPVYILVLVGVGTLGLIVFRAWRARNPLPGSGNRMATGKLSKADLDAVKPPPRDPNKPPPPKLNIPAPPKKPADGGTAPAPAPPPAPAPAAPAPAGGAAEAAASPLRLRSRPDRDAQVVLVDLDAS